MSETVYSLMQSTWFWSVLSIIAFIPCIVIHEVSHGYVAYKYGDNTAKNAGRLTLNPLKHIDPFGTVILPLLLAICNLPVFGYAKPVPYNPNNLKDKKKGELLVAFAGPVSNLLMAIIGAILGAALYYSSLVYSDAGIIIFYFLYYFSLINLILLFFNIIPLPPLDGASILILFLPKSALPTYYKIQQYALPILLIVMVALPYLFNIDILSGYFDVTAYNLLDLLYPYMA